MKSNLIGVSIAQLEAEAKARKAPQPPEDIPKPAVTAAEIPSEEPTADDDEGDDPFFDDSVDNDVLLAIEETGNAPNNSKAVHAIGTEHQDKSGLISALRAGIGHGPVVPYETPDAEDVLQALHLAGWALRYDKADLTLHARHRSKSGEGWRSIHPKKNPPLAATLAETCNRLMVEVKEKAKGKSIVWIARKPSRPRCSINGSYPMHDELLGLASGARSLIPQVHPFAALFDAIADEPLCKRASSIYRATPTSARRGYCARYVPRCSPHL